MTTPKSNTQSSDTPHVARVGGASSASRQADTNAKKISDFRRTASTKLRKVQLFECSSVVELCTPTGNDARTKAREVAGAIHQAMEADILAAAAADGDGGAADSGVEDGGAEDGGAGVAARLRALRIDPPPEARGAVERLLPWLAGRLRGKRETAIYPAYTAFVQYVAHYVGSTGAPRVVLPCTSDRKPVGSDEEIRVDTALVVRPDVAEAAALVDEKARPACRDVFAYTETKDTVGELADAYDQLLRYSRQIYAQQHDRRFVWGVALCATTAHLVLLTTDHAVASDAMDLATAAGRQAFLRVLVDLSFCSEAQLGYDPTVVWRAGPGTGRKGHWEIKCPALDGGTATYYARDSPLPADRLFGRHTRGFLASRRLEDVDSPDVFIKDAWAHSSPDASDDPRDEARLLQVIRNELDAGSDDDERPPYVRLEHGGPVRFEHGGMSVMDTTAAVLGRAYQGVAAQVQARAAVAQPPSSTHDDDAAEQPRPPAMPYRVHRRLAMSPVGEPLDRLTSAYELIVVMADAMRTHAAILDRCGILHRDISYNNILAVRTEGRCVRGLLVDFDCAVKVGADRIGRPERTGTPPFMSIQNLLGGPAPRSELDDWESALYVFCWFGMYGVSEADRAKRRKEMEANQELLSGLKLWEIGTFEEIGAMKSFHVGSKGRFRGCVLSNFIPGEDYDMLKMLARRLHRFLFFNPGLDPEYRGVTSTSAPASAFALAQADGSGSPTPKPKGVVVEEMAAWEDDDDDDDDLPEVDPFQKRLEVKDKIVADLLGIVAVAASGARRALGF
ncbi:hypothetical protein H4R18_004349 [Coemansia javaensis]|uniref:Fungal-type protein kinase domain-containing protein n=1 Tax=Coemansia javaensis TaxID=2761396 RepID=A0A9W8LH84_9FUNG|nr:hypothetical protein H4R18_004349 [Coemansia javaensis]